MDRTLRNTIAVLVLTAFTALAIFATVQLTVRITGVDTASAASYANAQGTYSGQYRSQQYGSSQNSSGQVYTCPATGCTASYCHNGR
jgi:hypothetical protein